MNNKLVLFITVSIGLFLRWHNVSPFKIYPDSYQNLLAAQSIITYHSVLGYLGPQGMLYPDFFTWTRPGYALLIALLTSFTKDMTLSAQAISFIAGILAIPLSFFFIKQIFKSTTTALAGAALVTVSFNHTIWSGFIMTETIGVLCLLLFLWSFSKHLKTKPSLIADWITGILFAFAIITRYEYAILLLPVIFLVFRQSPKPLIRLLTTFSATACILSLVAILLFPLQSTFSIIADQLSDIFKIIVILISVSVFAIFFKKIISNYYQQYFSNKLPHILLITLWLLVLWFTVLSNAAWHFVHHDFLLSIFSLLGITFMMQKKELRDYAFFVLFSVVSLGLLYYHTNPGMERYFTHLIPFLLIPASYGLIEIVNKKKRVISIAVVILVILQTIITFNGLRPSQDASWFRTAYEEKAAKLITPSLPKNAWLIVSEPEPYFYNLHMTTYSIADSYPFIFIDGGNDNQKIIIVEDMGMHMYFPHFTEFLETHLKSFEKKRFFVYENYHIENMTKKEIYPVVIYALTLKELKIAIAHTDF